MVRQLVVALFVQEDVLWLEISIDDPALVQVLESKHSASDVVLRMLFTPMETFSIVCSIELTAKSHLDLEGPTRKPRHASVFIEREEKTPTPKILALLRKRPVLLRANVVPTKDRKRPYYKTPPCGKIPHREGSCSKAAGGP